MNLLFRVRLLPTLAFFIGVATFSAASAATSTLEYFESFHTKISEPIAAYCATNAPTTAKAVREAVDIYNKNAKLANASLIARIGKSASAPIPAEIESFPKELADSMLDGIKTSGDATKYCNALALRLKSATPETLRKIVDGAYLAYEELAKERSAKSEGAVATGASKERKKDDDSTLAPVFSENLTPLDMGMFEGEDDFGHYYSVTTKISFDYDAAGEMTRAATHEPVISSKNDQARDFECTEFGGGANQRTVWFPDTAIFVYGGKLQAVTVVNTNTNATTAGTLPLLPLTKHDQGTVVYKGVGAIKNEFAYIPCVGAQRVEQGHRLKSFLPRAAVFNLTSNKSNVLKLSLPQPNEPHLILRYHAGEIIPVPMRPVVVSVDMEKQRVTVQYQSTFPTKPALRKVELRAVLSGDVASPGETQARYRERTDAILDDLRRCTVPTQPMEPCANPKRSPNRLIYSAR
jgi:hypothetical protein